MIALQSLLFTALGTYAGLTALVGSRIYPDIAPQGVAKPYAVWQEIFFSQATDLDGSAQTGGLDNYHIQVSSWATTATAAREVDAQVRAALQAGSGFKSLLEDGRSLGFEADTKLFGAQSDFSIWIKT